MHILAANRRLFSSIAFVLFVLLHNTFGQCPIPIACGSPAPLFKVICSPDAEVLASSLFGQQLLNPTPALTTAQYIVVFGTLVIDQNYTFSFGSMIVMTEDSKIRISGGNTLTLRGVTVRGCDKLWDRIQIDPNAKLDAKERTSFEDAVMAIDVKPSGSLSLDNCTFTQNFICIGSMQSSAANLGTVTIKTCDFNGATQLPESVVFGNNLTNFPLYAVKVENTNAFPIGVGTTPNARNLIHDYSTAPSNLVAPYDQPIGIWARNSNVNVRNTRFLNIGSGGTPPHGMPEVGGVGIDFASSNGSHRLTLTGLGKYGISTFQNCHRFVLCNFGRVTISNVFGSRTTIGFELKNAPSVFGSISISQSRIDNYVYRAILCLAEAFPAGQTIISNSVVTDNSEDTYANNSSPRFGFTLMNNTVPTNTTHSYQLLSDTFNNANKVLEVPNTFGFNINRMIRVLADKNLAINQETFAGEYNGFRILLGRSNVYSYNRVYSTTLPTAGYSPQGIAVTSSGRSDYFCNNLYNSRQDFSFDGAACDNSRLIRNQMLTSNTEGLSLSASTIIGQQRSFRNTWDNMLNTNVNEARFASTIAFHINLSAIRVFEPEGSGSIYWAQPRLPTQGTWFQASTVNNNVGCPVDSYQLPTDERTEADGTVLTNAFPAYLGYAGSTWDAKFRLFEKLAGNPGLRPTGSQEESFYNGEVNSTLGKLSAVLTGVSTLGEPSTTVQSTMATQAAGLDNLLDGIAILDESLSTEQDPQTVSSLKAQRNTKLTDLGSASTAYNQTLSSWSSEVTTRLQNLNTQLAAIGTSAIYEQNLKSVLGVVLQLLATPEIEAMPNSAQQAILQPIAYQCSHGGGQGVLLARAMLNLNLDMDYNCTQQSQGAAEDRMQESLQKVTVYPNPATEVLTIHSKDKQPFDAVIIFNELGQIVYQANNLTTHDLQIPIVSLPRGIYTVKVSASGKPILTEKIVLVY